MTLLNKHLAVVRSAVLLGANIACVMDLITPCSPVDMVWSRFFGAISTHDTNVCVLWLFYCCHWGMIAGVPRSGGYTGLVCTVLAQCTGRRYWYYQPRNLLFLDVMWIFPLVHLPVSRSPIIWPSHTYCMTITSKHLSPVYTETQNPTIITQYLVRGHW